ncbi:MAG: hypothetical protein ACP5IG_04850, partial [Candidatus Micrarchaeia archaeon]
VLKKPPLTYYGMPGQVAEITKEGIWVLTGDGAILLQKVVSDGKEVEANQIIKSIRKKLGH